MAQRAVYEGRINDYVWLEINDAVMRWRATLYSSDNAVANRAVINSDPSTALESDSIQAEVLVLAGLNVRWITFPQAGQSQPSTFRARVADVIDDDDIPF